MVDKNDVMHALETVKDPELHQNIVALNMVRDVAINTSDVTVNVALTVEGCPLHQRISDDVKQAVSKVPGVERVVVDLSVMNDTERRDAFSRAFQATQSKKPQTEQAKSAPAAPGRNIGPLPGQGPASGMMSEDNRTIVIGIASGKGGVGKSTVTANLAVALARAGHKVGVVDMDIYGFSQGRMFGASGQAKVNEQEKIIPWHVHDVDLVTMGMFVPESQAIVWRGPMLGKMLQQFFTDVAWPDLDYLLIDLPPGTGDVALDIAQKIRKAKLVIVTTPQEVATQVARRAADVAQRASQELVGVIENMSYVRCPNGDKMEIFGAGGGDTLSQTLEVPLLGQIPLEATVRTGSDEGNPAIIQNKDSEAGQVFLQIAQKLIAAVS